MANNRFLLTGAVLFICTAAAVAELRLTVYDQDLGLVREHRQVELKKGRQTIAFGDIAAQIDPTSVHLAFPAITSGISILEQNFAYDLVSRQKLLERCIGQDITLERRAGKNGDDVERISGTLLSVSDGITLLSNGRILINPAGELSLQKLPEGLILKPTLSWLMDSSVTGGQNAEIDYLTAGIGWSADYVLVVAKDGASLGLTGWVTIDNRSGATYRDATLKLVAGTVHRAAEDRALEERQMRKNVMYAAAAPQFEEKPFFDYHLYTLARPATIRDNETKQIEFIRAGRVASRTVYLFDPLAQYHGSPYQPWMRSDRSFGTQSTKKVMVALEFKNAAAAGLGMPLPKGRMRAYREDDDGALQFVGEDRIDHTPRDEQLHLTLGEVFDIAAERVQTDFKGGSDWCEESVKVSFRNHKDEAVEITSVERLARAANWKITAKTDPYEKTDSRTAQWKLKVPANGEKTLVYTVKYWW